MSKLGLDPQTVAQARDRAASIASRMDAFIRDRSTVAVERTVLRLAGIDGVDADDVPLPNVVVDDLQEAGALESGVLRFMGRAMLQTGRDPQVIAEAMGAGDLRAAEEHVQAVEIFAVKGQRRQRDQRGPAGDHGERHDEDQRC